MATQSYLIIFASTHAALSFERALGNDGQLIPVPPAIRAGCGMGLRFVAQDSAQAYGRVEALSEQTGLGSAVEGSYVCVDGSYEESMQNRLH